MTEQSKIQNDLFELLGIKDGDQRYAECLLISRYVLEYGTEAKKEGFYAGQANAGVSLNDCHDNFKKWNKGSQW